MPSTSPNILFIAVDDLNDWVGVLGGHPQTITPNIDALSRSGVLFRNAHTQAPLCAPSRTSVLTGKYPSTTGVYFQINDLDVREASDETRSAIYLHQYFEANGYRTFSAGKIWHGNDLAGTFGEVAERREWFGPNPPERLNYDPVKGPNYEGIASTSTDWGAFPERDDQMPDQYYADWAIERLRMEHDQPFFLAVGFVRPHVPWYVPQAWMDRHPRDGVVLPPYLESDMDDIPENGRRMAFTPPMPTTEYLKERDQWKDAVQAYLASVTWTDHQVGRLLKALQESPHARNTLVVLFSDHGYHLGEKNRFAKMSLWERDTHVPLIIAGPGLRPGESRRSVGLIDLYPTLVELAGLPSNPDTEGRSLLPLLHDPDASWPYPVITQFGPRNMAVRGEQVRYIRYEDGSEEFYDHRTDPNEWKNLAFTPESRRAVAARIEELARFMPTDPAPLAEKSSYDNNEYHRQRMPIWRVTP